MIASFQAKIGWERPRKSENKKKSFRCLPTQHTIENSQKIVKKIQEIINHNHSFFSSQNRMGKAVNERKLLKKKKSRSYVFLLDSE